MLTGVDAIELVVEPVASFHVTVGLLAVGIVEIESKTIGSGKLK